MKRFLALGLALLLTAALCACGDKTDDTGATTTTTTGSTTSTTAADDFVAPQNYASVITITINPQFRLYLDAAGEVLAVEPVNADAKSVAADVTVKTGNVKDVVENLVTAVDKGGFVKENATVEIAVTEVKDTAVDTAVVLETVKEAAEESFTAVTVPVVIQTTVATTTTTQGTTSATESSTSGTTTSTTKATTTTATTAKGYSPFNKYDWIFRVIVEQDGTKFCGSYTLILQEGKLRIGTSSAMLYEEMVPESDRDKEKPSFSFGGMNWYEGSGGFGSMTSAVEKDNTLTFTGDSDLKLNIVLTRTSETTAKVVSTNLPFPIKVGDVFNAVPPTPIQDEEPEPEGNYTPVAKKGGAWMGGYKAKDGTYRLITLVLCGDNPNLDMAIGDPLSGFPEEVQPDVKPDCEEFDGEFYYFGRGDGGAITTVAETGSTVEVRDEDGEKMYLKRTDENTFKIDGCSNRFAGMEDFPSDMVFTFAAEQ